MAYIEVIGHNEAQGRLAAIYEELLKKRGKLANVMLVHSLNPESLIAHMDLYMTIMFAQSPLSRPERELMAVVVSLLNKCTYCQQHHKTALGQYWKDDDRISRLLKDPYSACKTERELALANYASNLTMLPENSHTEQWALELKERGFEDRAILDATLVVAYFNFVNRLVLGLGVQQEAKAGEGYNY